MHSRTEIDEPMFKTSSLQGVCSHLINDKSFAIVNHENENSLYKHLSRRQAIFVSNYDKMIPKKKKWREIFQTCSSWIMWPKCPQILRLLMPREWGHVQTKIVFGFIQGAEDVCVESEELLWTPNHILITLFSKII